MIVMLIVVMTFPILLSSCQFDILGKEEEYRITNVKILRTHRYGNWHWLLRMRNPYNREIGKRESGVAELSGTEIWSDFTVVGSWDGKV